MLTETIIGQWKLKKKEKKEDRLYLLQGTKRRISLHGEIISENYS